ncbi:uncharacterized protein LOC108915840 [Anoplophora glabripennis]|uniref:uncharacterized protein LOC108915840 n=1 Tax=Anoplophora glabripennis TaxID=217634 RepID=UPI00087461FA|nr:uncharacterized protein LOC108915840 [Anoplophora glabripennis]
MDYIKRFFGLSDENQFNRILQQDQSDNEESRRSPNPRDDIRPSFHVFSDPLEMHRYFEYQMNEILKFFGAQEFDNGIFSNFHSNLPALQEDTEFNEGENSSKYLREQFLKSGYEKPSQKHFEKMDKDIDGRIQLGDLDSVFGRKRNRNSNHTSEGYFFGQSQSIKTIRNPDGSIETHRTVKDNKGNEETTVCQKIGDKEFCIIKKKDKYGKEEIIENLINMSEEEKNSLFKDKFPTEKHDGPKNDLFDKFFR